MQDVHARCASESQVVETVLGIDGKSSRLVSAGRFGKGSKYRFAFIACVGYRALQMLLEKHHDCRVNLQIVFRWALGL